MDYRDLCQASLTTDYLHTNSTTHEFLFGALAELVDNSRDAKAKNLHIYTEKTDYNLRGGFSVCFLDDGEGMSPKEAKEVIEFGNSNKKNVDLDLIGQYGNGLKSGSMRLGNDLIVFTKKEGSLTILLLSRDFLGAEKQKKIIICLPSFSDATKEPIYDVDEKNRQNKRRHEIEMKLILKYSPYRTMEDLMSQFDKIKGQSGTLCVIYSLKLNIDGEPELDIHTNPHDIMMSSINIENEKLSKPEQKSFREYVSILYYNPRMKVYIQNKKVKTKRLETTLHKPLRYFYMSKKFKSRAEAEVKEATQRLKNANESLREATSKFQHFIPTYDRKSKEDVLEYTKLLRAKEDASDRVVTEKLNLERKTQSSKNGKGLEFIFGINIHNRDADGLYLYNSNRLIRFSERARMQKKPKSPYRGIVGIVNVPYLVLEPTHNKQSFAESAEQQLLISTMSDHMEQYFLDCEESFDNEFWKKFGYLDTSDDPPLYVHPYTRIRIVQTKIVVQCNNDNCLKWRDLPTMPVDKYLLVPGFVSDDWTCDKNPVTGQNSCRNIEKLPEITERRYDPERKTQQKNKEHEKEMQRKQKREELTKNSYQDFDYDDNDDDEPPIQKKKISQENPAANSSAAFAKNLYSSLNQKPADKLKPKQPTQSSLISTSSTSAASSKAVNQSVLRPQSLNNNNNNSSEKSSKNTSIVKGAKPNESLNKLKRFRFEDDSEATTSSNDDESTRKKKTKETDSTYRPGQKSQQQQVTKNTSRKSTAIGQVVRKKPPVIVETVIDSNESDDNEDNDQESDLNEQYRNTLQSYNDEQNSVEQPNISTLVAKPEPTDPVRMETTFDLERFSLDSRTIQDVSDRSLSLRPDISNKNNDTLLKAITVSYCHVLADIAEKMNDEGIKNQIDNFKDLTEVANFPATIITSKLTDYIAEERKKSIRRLKKKLIKEHNISETAATDLLKDF